MVVNAEVEVVKAAVEVIVVVIGTVVVVGMLTKSYKSVPFYSCN